MAAVIIDGDLSTKCNNFIPKLYTDDVNIIDLGKEILPYDNLVSCFVNVNVLLKYTYRPMFCKRDIYYFTDHNQFYLFSFTLNVN